jgi:hypothetical protein
MPQLTSGEKVLLRANGHKLSLYMSHLQPDTLLSATANLAAAAKGDRTLTYDGGVGTSAEFARITAYMPMWIGTARGDNDGGVVRIKSITGDEVSGTITVAENTIDWADGEYWVIKDDHPLFSMYPLIPETIGDPWFKDYDVAYTDQNEEPPPVAIMGPHRADFLSSGTVRFYLDGTDSYPVAPGAVINSHAWACPKGGSINNASASQTYIDFTNADEYWVSLTVTDDNGKSQITYRCFFAHDPVIGNAKYPHTDFEISSINGSWDRGGWSADISVKTDGLITDIPEKTLVVIWQDAIYGSTAQNIGGWKLGDADARNVLLCGYVREETIQRNWDAGEIQFELATINEVLRNTGMSSVGLNPSASPSEWYEYKNLTIARTAHHLWRYHSTLFEITDVVLPVGNTWQMLGCYDMIGGDLYSQIDTFAYNNGIFAHVCCEKNGRLHLAQDANMLDSTDRAALTTVSDITEPDRKGSPDLSIMKNPVGQVSSAVVSGVSYDGSTATPLISVAPGEVPLDEGSQILSIERQVLDDQSQLNELSGRILAKANRPLREIPVPFKGHYLGALELVPQEWWTLTLVAADTVRGIEFTDQKLVCREINASYSAKEGAISVDSVFEPEFTGDDGETSSYPVDPPSTDYPDPDPPTEPGDPDPPSDPTGLGKVYVGTGTHIGRTLGLDKSGGADWTDVTGAIVGTIIDGILDPWDPLNTAYVFTRVGVGSTTSGLWKTTNLNDASPTWTLKKSIASMEGDSPGTNASQGYTKIVASINWEGYLSFVLQITGGTNYLGHWHSHDGGDSWSYSTILSYYLWIDWRGAYDIVPHEVGGELVMYVCHIRDINLADYVRIGRSVDHGHTWTADYFALQADWNSGTHHAYSLTCPYEDNEAGTRYYVSWELHDTAKRQFARCVGTSKEAYITPVPGSFGSPTFHRTGYECATHDQDKMFVFDKWGGVNRLRVSDNRGDDWTDMGLTSGKGIGAQVHAAGGFPYNDQLFYVLGTNGIFYSTDRGATFNDATGNWATEIGAFGTGKFIVPMWLE